MKEISQLQYPLWALQLLATECHSPALGDLVQLYTTGTLQVLTGMVLWLSHGGVMYWQRTECQSISRPAG